MSTEPSATDIKNKLPESELNKKEDAAMNTTVDDITAAADQTVPSADNAPEAPSTGVKPLEEYTLKELQAMATGEGVFQAEAFTTKAQLIALIANMRSMKATIKAERAVAVNFNPAALKLKGMDQGRINQIYQEKMENTRKKYLEGEKTNLMIPLDIGEKPGSYATVLVNGWRCDYLKGVMHYSVPVGIAQVLLDSMVRTAEVGQDMLIDSLAKKIDDATGQPKNAARLGFGS